MDPQRWSMLSSLLDELLDLDEPARNERLEQVSANDAELAAQLRDWLARDAEQPEFLAEPVIDAGAFAPQPGQTLGPYRLEALIGEGGMGQVWRAVRADGLYQRRVALKLLRPGLGDAGLRARFTRERQILARLGHAHIARLLDAGLSQDGQPYLALDYVQGLPITGYAEQMALGVDARLELFLQVCAAVSHAHANLVVHRDLKPSNILVTPAGEVCLLDFGIAKLLDESGSDGVEITRTGARAFTLHYAAPEQLRQEPVTTMTDVYALGVVLYELLAGRKPYLPARSSDAAWEEAILCAEPSKPSQAAHRLARDTADAALRRRAGQLLGDLDTILLKALSKLPEMRYASVEAFAQDIRRHLSGQPINARAQSVGYRARKYLHRHALAISVVLVIGGFLMVALALVSWQAERALVQATRAQAMQDFVVALFEHTDRAGSDQGLDVRTLLDAGVRRADTELTGQPLSRAELLGLIARLRAGLGDDRQALELLDRQAALLALLTPADADRIGLEAAALRGRSLRELGGAQHCIDALAPWLPRRDALSRDFPLAAAELLSQLGRCHRQLGGLDVARDLFGQALSLRRSQSGARLAEAESQADLALLLGDAGKPAEGRHSMLGALRLLRGAGGDRNALGVQVWQGLGRLYWEAGDAIESEASYRQALEITLGRFGVAHPLTASVQRALGELLVKKGKLHEAERLLQIAHEHLRRQLGDEHLELAPSWQKLGEVQAELARPQAAVQAFEQVVRLQRREDDPVALARAVCQLSAVSADAGEDGRAETYAEECRLLAERAQSPAALVGLQTLARLELARGNVASAAAWLALSDTVRRRFAETIDGDAARLLHARIALASGDAVAAEALLAAVLAGSGENSARTSSQWRAAGLRAGLRCRTGGTDARSAFQREATRLARLKPEHLRLQQEHAGLAGACRVSP